MFSVILPAHNEEEGIGRVVSDLRAAYPEAEVLVVDDGSTDRTAELARAAGARVVRHPRNRGNGAAVKTGIRRAKNDVLVMMDADGQHDPDEIKKLLECLPEYDMAVGARSGSSHGYFHRNLANLFYNKLASYLADYNILDLTSGFRAVKRKVIRKFIYLFPNGFSYPTTSTLALLRGGYNLKYVPIEAKKRVGKSKLNLVRDGVGFILVMFKIIMMFSPFKIFAPAGFLVALLGAAYYLYTYLVWQQFRNMSVLLISIGILIFMLGLIAEQIAQLRMQGIEEEEG
jgi:glycosyltransferase involved in cell wall biosynthesis